MPCDFANLEGGAKARRARIRATIRRTPGSAGTRRSECSLVQAVLRQVGAFAEADASGTHE